MKITLYTSNVKNKNAILEATNIVKEWTKDILPLEFVIKETKATFTSMPFDNSASTNNGASSGYMVNPGDMVMLIDEKADITALIYDNSKMNPKPTNPVQNPWKLGNSTIIQMSEQWYNQLPDVCAMYLYHEIVHAMFFLLGKGGQDKVHYQHENPAFSQKQPYQWYQYLMISLLEDWKKYKGTETKTMTTYKYFTEKEIKGLKPELVSLLDTARGIAGTPFVITSGLRSPEKNREVGGKANSAHLTGEAVDIACTDSAKRFKIVTALLNVGFKRIEVTNKHIHVDVSKTLPQNVFFLV